MSHIRIQNISKIFGRDAVNMLQKVHQGMDKATLLNQHQHGLGVYDINLDINAGEIFVIMGLSGSGKSTLIRHFNRLIEPTEGQILVNEEDITRLSPAALRQFRRDNMSMVFQHFGLMPHRKVIDNVGYGLSIQNRPADEIKKTAHHWLELVGLAGYHDAYPKSLSGGQQQRVGLARALATNSDILLMDEAFSALDPLIRSQMQDQLLELQTKLNKTIIFITHDLSEALKLGSRIAILSNGKLAQVGTPEDILLNPADDYVREFVRDVSRSDIVTAKHIMRQPTLVLSQQNNDEARQLMEEKGETHAWLATPDGVSVVSKLQLLQQPTSSPAALATPLKTLPSSATLAALIPLSIGNTQPIALTDAKGNFVGIVEAEHILQMLQEESKIIDR